MAAKKQMGDLLLQDEGKLGFSVFDRKGKRLCFFNQLGAWELAKWIEKHKMNHLRRCVNKMPTL
jgi:hypothetical protein